MADKKFETLDGIDSAGPVVISNTVTVTSNAVFDTNTLYVDAVNNRVGVGKTPAQGILDVNGNVHATQFHGDGSNVTSVNATTLDSIDSTQFLRSDTSDSLTSGTLTINSSGGGIRVTTGFITLNDAQSLNFGTGSDVVFSNDGVDVTVTGGKVKFANTIVSTVTTGTAPFTVASTTKVTNLNADLLDGVSSASFLQVSGTQNYTSGTLTFNSGVTVDYASGSTVNFNNTTGTAPFTVDSTTVVTNLNADRLDGIQGTSFLRSDTTDSYTSGTLSFSSGTTVNYNSGSTVNFNNTTGTAPFTVDSTTVVTNLNADTVDGIQGSSILTTSTNFGGDVSGTYNAIVVANDSHTHDGRYYTETEADSRFVNVTGDTINGTLVVGGTSVSGGEGGEIQLTAPPTTSISGTHVSLDLQTNSFRIFESGGTNRGAYVNLTECAASSGSEIWHSSNDGSGSGLDADLLDGQHGSSYLRSNATDAYTAGTLSFNSGTTVNFSSGSTVNFDNTTGTTPFTVDSATLVTNLNADRVDGYNATSLLKSDESDSYTSGTLTFNSGTTVNYNSGATVNFNNTTGTTPFTVDSTTVVTNLNADLLDGQQGSYYRNASNINAGTINDAYLPGTISSNITGNAATATDVAITATSTSASFRMVFTDANDNTVTNGSLLKDSAANFYYNPSTNTLTVPNLSGNASTATNADQLDGQHGSYYQNASNLNAGTVNPARLNVPVSGGWWSGGAAVVGTDGVMEIGAYIDFHASDTTTADNDVRLTATTTQLQCSKSFDAPEVVSDHFKYGTVTTTGVNKTVAKGEYCIVTAATKTITLPSSPAAGDTVTIGVRDFTDTIIARNGSNIMGLAENLTIDAAYATLDFVYINASIGWNVQ